MVVLLSGSVKKTILCRYTFLEGETRDLQQQIFSVKTRENYASVGFMGREFMKANSFIDFT